MGDNKHLYGFRWSKSNGFPMPKPLRMHVASAQDDQDDSANSVHIYPGDPVTMVATGGVIVAKTGVDPFGVMVAVDQYYEASTGLMRKGPYYPNQTTWGTVEARRGYVLVVPFLPDHIWEIDCDDAVTATTEATYRALIHSNCTHVVPGNTANQSADPYLDISSTNTTNTLEFRIVDISQTTYNRDFSGNYVKVLVSSNVSQYAGQVESGEGVAGV